MCIPRVILLLMTATLMHASPARAEEAARVSIIQLLANPGAYEGKLVEVSGFVNLEFEGNAIWLHQEDFQQSLYPNALWLDVSAGKCTDAHGNPLSAYATVSGRFTATAHGHMGLWPGQIQLVGSCFPLPEKR